MEQERLDLEFEEAKSWNENKRVKFTSKSEGNTKSGGNGELQEGQASERQPMAPPGQEGFRETYAKPWCNECKSHHMGNYSRDIRVWCYQCGEIGYYAHDCLEKIL